MFLRVLLQNSETQGQTVKKKSFYMLSIHQEEGLECQWSSFKIAGIVKYQCLWWQCCSASRTNLSPTSNLTEIHSVNIKNPELRLQVTLPPHRMRLHRGMTSLQKLSSSSVCQLFHSLIFSLQNTTATAL